MIGEECDLLGIASPYSYIATKATLCFVAKVEDFFRIMLDLNPRGLQELKIAASAKLKEFGSTTRKKRGWDAEVGKVESI